MMSARLHGCGRRRCISVWEQQKILLGLSSVAAGDDKAKFEVDFTADIVVWGSSDAAVLSLVYCTACGLCPVQDGV